jgi:hypothetical protein
MDKSRFVLASLLLIVGSLLFSGCAPLPGKRQATSAANATSGHETSAVAYIRFYDDDDADGHNYCTLTIDRQPYDFSGELDCTNDEARSAKLQNVPAGTTIALYDAKRCGDHDDYSVIEVTRTMPEIVVRGFSEEVSYTDWNLRAYYNNGLMGKVSCVIVHVPAPLRRPENAARPPPAK